jgi:hypothetical protein
MCIWYGKVVGRLIVQKKKLRPKAKASCLHVVVQPSHVKFCGSLLPHLREKGCQLVTWNSYEYHYTECPYRNVQCANRFVSMCAIVHICSLVYVCGMYIYICIHDYICNYMYVCVYLLIISSMLKMQCCMIIHKHVEIIFYNRHAEYARKHPTFNHIPSGYLTYPWYRWPIEIDGTHRS